METQKALLEQQKKNEEDKIRRMQEDAARKLEEAQINAERDIEKQNTILKLSKEVEEKAAAIRSQRTDNLSAVQRISVIEGEKQALSSILTDVSDSIAEYNAKLDAECEGEKATRKARTPRTSFAERFRCYRCKV